MFRCPILFYYIKTNNLSRLLSTSKNDATTSPSNSSLFSPDSSCLYLPPTLGLSLLLYSLSHPRTAGHAPSPVSRLQLIRAAGANLHQIGFTCILVHLCSSQDVCVLYEEVRCKSYDLAAVPGAFGTAATPAPHRWASEYKWKGLFWWNSHNEIWDNLSTLCCGLKQTSNFSTHLTCLLGVTSRTSGVSTCDLVLENLQ
jgi:hypothetical protein